MEFQDFIKPELLILIPVLYFIGTGVKKIKKIPDSYIPMILGGVGVVLSSLWVLATSDITSYKETLVALFTSITQGILLAGASVYSNQLIKQFEKKGD